MKCLNIAHFGMIGDDWNYCDNVMYLNFYVD